LRFGRRSTRPVGTRKLFEAGAAADADHTRNEAANRKLEDCGQRLASYRKLLDAATDPALVAGWISEVKGERLRAGQEIRLAQPSGQPTMKQVRHMAESLTDRLASCTLMTSSSRCRRMKT
jgi:hypothetical protein